MPGHMVDCPAGRPVKIYFGHDHARMIGRMIESSKKPVEVVEVAGESRFAFHDAMEPL